MKRILLIAFGSILALVIAILVVLRLPATQRWLLQRAVADVPGLKLEVEHLSAGLSGAEVRGVVARTTVAVVRLPRVQASYDGWTLLTKRELVVRELTAPDVLVELLASEAGSPASTGADGTAAQAFAGFLAPLQLPVRATIEAVQVGGRVRVSAQQSLTFSAQGKLLVPGQNAVTNLSFEWTDSTEGVAARNLGWVGQLATSAAAGGAVERVALEGSLAMPSDKPGAPQHGLVTKIGVGRATDGTETVDLAIRLSTAKEAEEPMAKAMIRYPGGAGNLVGEWSLQLNRGQLEGVLDLNVVPDFTAAAQGTFSAAVATGDFSASGQATVDAAKLQRLRRELSALGSVGGRLEFAFERRGERLRLEKLTTTLSDARGPVLELEALQPVTYRLDTQAVEFAQADKDLVRLNLTNLPLAWVQPWLRETSLGGTVTAGEVRIRGTGSAWFVETSRPLAFSGVRYGPGKTTAVDQLAGELVLRGGVDGTAWSLDLLDLNLRSAATNPVFSALTAKLEARQDAAGRGRLALPVTLANAGRRSQLRLEGEWALGAETKAVSAKLSGDAVYLRDLGALAALAPSSSTPPPSSGAKAKPAPTTPATAAKDARAFWAGIDGKLEIDIARVVLDSEELAGVQATLACNERQLVLEKLAASAKGTPLAARLAVDFDHAKPAPYTLSGSCTFPGFDLGAWLRAANPDEEPAIESVLDIDAKVEGQGANLGDLLAGLRGDFVLQGGPGVLRVKDKKVETASALGGLVLGLLSKDKQQKPAVAVGAQLIEEMREFRFERFEVSLQRSADMDLQFRAIDLRSAQKRLSGTGKARHMAGRTIAEYPLELEMWLAGKDDFAALLEQGRLLDGTKDELGYARLRQPFTVGGTVGAPNWKKMLALLAAGLALGK